MKSLTALAILALTSAHPSGVPHDVDHAICAAPADDTSLVDNVTISSYHIHVLYKYTDASRTNALSLRDMVIKEFDLEHCPGWAHLDKACYYNHEGILAGPWPTRQWSVYLLPENYETMAQFVLKHRGILDVMIHPNSGCEHKDHNHWAVWSGDKWPLNNVFNPLTDAPDTWRPAPDREIPPPRLSEGDVHNPTHWRDRNNDATAEERI